jgi:hypothetical protein
LLDAKEDPVPVQRPERDGLEDEEIESALQEFGRGRHTLSSTVEESVTLILLGCQGECPT